MKKLIDVPRGCVVIVLTRAEARALSRAIGNSIYSHDDAMDVLGHMSSVKAAVNGHEKLKEVLRKKVVG